MAAEPIVEGARAVQEHPGDRSGTQTATRGAPRSAPTTTDGPDANPRGGKGVNLLEGWYTAPTMSHTVVRVSYCIV